MVGAVRGLFGIVIFKSPRSEYLWLPFDYTNMERGKAIVWERRRKEERGEQQKEKGLVVFVLHHFTTVLIVS